MMRDKTNQTKAVQLSKLHVHKPFAQQLINIIPPRPPRPPCWLDFVDKSASADSRVSAAGSSGEADAKKNRSTCSSSLSKHKRHAARCTSSVSEQRTKGLSTAKGFCVNNAKLKRTRSEPCISDQEIPSDVILSHSRSRKVKIQAMEEAKRYLENTYLKCSQWLAQISIENPPTNPNTQHETFDSACNIESLVDEFSSIDLSTEDDLNEKKRYSLDRIPE